MKKYFFLQNEQNKFIFLDQNKNLPYHKHGKKNSIVNITNSFLIDWFR